MEEKLYTVMYHFENVPNCMIPIIKRIFVGRRNEAARAVRGMYSGINSEWDKTGKPTSFGPYLQDINPEYAAFINSRIQPILDKKVNKNRLFRMVSSVYGDIEMTIRGLKKSRVWIDLKEVE